MLDPERHELPEIVLSLMATLQEALGQVGAPDPALASRQLTTQILRNWGGIQTYITTPGSRAGNRFCDEIRIWSMEMMEAYGFEPEAACDAATQVADRIRQYYAGLVLKLPQDSWSMRSEVARRFNGHNMVDLCREYRISTTTLYRIVFEERNPKRAQAG